MKEIGSVIARRLAFLEREFDRMGDAADDAEHELRLNPTDPAARRRLEAIYALANETSVAIRQLRHDDRGQAAIRYDRHADTVEQRAFRQGLC